MINYTPEELAQLIYEVQERLAPEHGFVPNDVPWDQYHEGRKRLLIATCDEVLVHIDQVESGAYV